MATYFSLIVRGADAISTIEAFRETSERADLALDENGRSEEPIKWYSVESDLTEFSLLYPEALFELLGEGEESGDIWKLYAKNGKSYREYARIEFDMFDPTRL